MKAFTSLAATLLCSSAVMAHFTLDYPTSRGFLDAAEGTASCGGFDALTNRTQFPLCRFSSRSLILTRHLIFDLWLLTRNPLYNGEHE